jgi:hypothetical protein
MSLERESRYEENSEFARRRVNNLTRSLTQAAEEAKPQSKE